MLPKDGVAIAQGAALTWDTAPGHAQSAASSDAADINKFGIALEARLAADAEVPCASDAGHGFRRSLIQTAKLWCASCDRCYGDKEA